MPSQPTVILTSTSQTITTKLPIGLVDEIFTQLRDTHHEGDKQLINMFLLSTSNNNTQTTNYPTKRTRFDQSGGPTQSTTYNELVHEILYGLQDPSCIPDEFIPDLLSLNFLPNITNLTLYEDIFEQYFPYNFGTALQGLRQLKSLKICEVSRRHSPRIKINNVSQNLLSTISSPLILPNLQKLTIEPGCLTMEGAFTLANYTSFPHLTSFIGLFESTYQYTSSPLELEQRKFLDDGISPLELFIWWLEKHPKLTEFENQGGAYELGFGDFVENFAQSSDLMSRITHINSPIILTRHSRRNGLNGVDLQNNIRRNQINLYSSPYLTKVKSIKISAKMDKEVLEVIKNMFLTQRWLSNVSTLGFLHSQNILNHDFLSPIIQSPYLTNVCFLDLSSIDSGFIRIDALGSLLHSPNLSNLVHISCHSSLWLCPAFFTFLTTSPHMTNLQILGCSGQISCKSLADIGNSKYLSKLISFGFNKIDDFNDEDFKTYIHSPNIAHITALNLPSIPLSLISLKNLATSPYLSHVNSLSLQLNPVEETNEYTKLLFQSSAFETKQLEILNLSSCNLNDQDLYHLAQSPFMSNLYCLQLKNNNSITDQGIKYITQSPYMSNLEILDLDDNHLITDESLKSISQSPFMSNLKRLRLLSRGMAERSIEYLCQSTVITQLDELTLPPSCTQATLELLNSTPGLFQSPSATVYIHDHSFEEGNLHFNNEALFFNVCMYSDNW